MANIIGHNQAIKQLINNLSVQSWLICGKKGIGKATLARSYAYWLLTKRVFTLDTTQSVKNIELQKMPYDSITLDLYIIEGDLIGIEKVREMRNFLYLSPIQSQYKIVVIDSLEKMTANAKNAMLKILEEPPPDAKILIISHRPYDIQATIKCRCFQINLSPLTCYETQQIVSFQHKCDDLVFDKMFALFPGSPGMIIRALNENIYELYECISQGLSSKLVSSDVDLELMSNIIQASILQSIKENIEDLESVERLFRKWKKINALFVAAQQFYLDRRHVLASVFNTMSSDIWFISKQKK